MAEILSAKAVSRFSSSSWRKFKVRKVAVASSGGVHSVVAAPLWAEFTLTSRVTSLGRAAPVSLARRIAPDPMNRKATSQSAVRRCHSPRQVMRLYLVNRFWRNERMKQIVRDHPAIRGRTRADPAVSYESQPGLDAARRVTGLEPTPIAV